MHQLACAAEEEEPARERSEAAHQSLSPLTTPWLRSRPAGRRDSPGLASASTVKVVRRSVYGDLDPTQPWIRDRGLVWFGKKSSATE